MGISKKHTSLIERCSVRISRADDILSCIPHDVAHRKAYRCPVLLTVRLQVRMLQDSLQDADHESGLLCAGRKQRMG